MGIAHQGAAGGAGVERGIGNKVHDGGRRYFSAVVVYPMSVDAQPGMKRRLGAEGDLKSRHFGRNRPCEKYIGLRSRGNEENQYLRNHKASLY